MSKFPLNTELTTRDGHKVVILEEHEGMLYGRMECYEKGSWFAHSWFSTGKHLTEQDHALDILMPKRKAYLVWTDHWMPSVFAGSRFSEDTARAHADTRNGVVQEVEEP